jgi:WD40 repeat protein
VRVWGGTAGAEIAVIPAAARVTVTTFSPDGSHIATAGEDGTVRICTTAENVGTNMAAPVREHTVAGRVDAITISPDQTLAAVMQRRDVRLLDINTGTERTVLPHPARVTAVVFSPDGDRLATCAGGDLTVWDVAAAGGPGRHRRLPCTATVTDALFSPDGAKVVAAADNGVVQIWDLARGVELPALPHDGWVTSLAFSADGASLVTAERGRVLRAWTLTGTDEATVRRPRLTKNCGSRINAVEVGTDARTVAIAADDGAHIWDITSGAELTPPLIHDGRVLSASFSRDRNRLATGSSDHLVRIWELGGSDRVSATEFSRIRHDDLVHTVVFSPDGTRIATTTGNGTVRVWPATPELLIAQAEQRLIRPLAEIDISRWTIM